MAFKALWSAGAPKPIGPYTPGVDTGSLVFVSGQLGIDPATGELVDGGIEEQAEQVMKNLAGILAAAGLTMADVAKTTCFLADMGDFAKFNEVYTRYVGDLPPARSTYAVAALPRGGRVEVEAIAVRS
jgi:2-iminobutanoate/2-iminopropanoate deaminase